MRTEFPGKVKVAAFRRANGRCEEHDCGLLLTPGKYHYDHIIPDQLGGEATLDNCAVLCLRCHGKKTATADVPAIAKAKRIERKHVGAHRSSRPMPGSRASKWKAKIGGGWERRT